MFFSATILTMIIYVANWNGYAKSETVYKWMKVPPFVLLSLLAWARARELMYAEEVAMLEKDIKKETAKAAAALKSLQEKVDERLNMELEQKEKEAELKLKEVKEFAKAKLSAAIAGEKAAQLEEKAEANVNINALCMAFYARSEEVRQTHSVHKLALGALALEDALSKGRAIQPEVDAIRTYLKIVDNGSLIDLVLSSLPEDIQSRGTDTPLQLNQKAYDEAMIDESMIDESYTEQSNVILDLIREKLDI